MFRQIVAVVLIAVVADAALNAAERAIHEEKLAEMAAIEAQIV